MELYIVLLSIIIFVLIGLYEKKSNDKNVEKIPIRINVNGIRGKSTITRLITSILQESDYFVAGKTTGSSPRLFGVGIDEEIEIVRNPKGVSISEQLSVIKWAAENDYDALVCECMAVNPEYQKVYQEEMIKANIGVIVNVLEDHMDVLGPTLDEVALSFSPTIPYNGYLVIQDNQFRDYFKEIAKSRNTKVIVADEAQIPQGYLDQFDFVVFPNNIAIALGVAKALNISEEDALKAMLKTNPDPGSLRFSNHLIDDFSFRFINGFAINDPQSVLESYDMLMDRKIIGDVPIILFNGRSDRIDRTIQFVEDCFPYIPSKIKIISVGEEVSTIEKAFKDNKIPNAISYTEIQKDDYGWEKLYEAFNGNTVFAVGNIHGCGYDIIDDLERRSEKNDNY